MGEGIADRDRVGIYGGSYGGYAALVGATFTPDVFAAAVSVVGPSSLVTPGALVPALLAPAAGQHLVPLRRRPRRPRAARRPRGALAPQPRGRTSAAPLLVIQGANDPRVTKAESDQIVAALRARGVRWSTWSRTTRATAS